METLKDYLNEDNVVKDELYKTFESSITCIICLDIIIEPTMCMKCQNVYCKECIKNWSKIDGKCPNRCENSNYQKCKSINELLSKINFNCKNCKNIINYNEVEKHCISKCQLGKNINNSENIEKPLTKRNYKFQKLETKEISSKESEMNITSKLKKIFIIIYIYIVITLGLSGVGKTSLINK